MRVDDSELHASVGDHYLLRALLRSAILKSLSTFLSRLSALVDQGAPATSPPPPPVTQQPPGVVAVPVQVSVDLAVARAAIHVRRGIDNAIQEPEMPGFVRETLSPWSEKLNGLVGRLVWPVVGGIKSSAAQLIGCARLSEESSTTSSAAGVRPAGNCGGGELKPKYLTDLAALLSSSKTLLVTRVDSAQEGELERWLVSVATHVVWKGLLAFSARPVGPSGDAFARRPSIPAQRGVTSPPVSPKRGAGLRLVGRRRSPSPTRDDGSELRLVRRVQAFKDIMVKFVDGVCKPEPDSSGGVEKSECDGSCGVCGGAKGLFRTVDNDNDDDNAEEKTLPSEAMWEALDALDAMLLVLKVAARCDGPELVGGALDEITAGSAVATTTTTAEKSATACRALVRALATVPPLILVHLVASRTGGEAGLRLPHELWGTTWDEYEHALSGFGAAEEWSEDVGWEMDRECERVLGEKNEVTARTAAWLGVLRRVVEARVD
jgi:hypothetical protein